MQNTTFSDEKNTTPHRLADRILEDIADPAASGFFPGVQLVENAMEEKYQVSRVTVRTALALLEGMGLVTNVPYKGRFVREFHEKEIQDMYIVRAVNEACAARLAADRITDEQIKELEGLLLDLEKEEKGNDTAAIGKKDYGFHAHIQKVCGNSMLDEILRRSQLLFMLIRVIHRDDPSLRRRRRGTHRQIFNAIRKRDGARAERAAWLHLEPSFA